MLFKNTTKYSRTVYQEFVDFHTKEYRFSYQLYTAMVCIAFLFCLVTQIAYHYYTSAICMAFMIAAFFLWRFFHPISSIQKESNKDKYQKENVFTFIFYDKSMKIIEENQIVTLSYYKLYKIFETNYFFYLYTDKNHAFLVNKSCFQKGTSQEFSSFVQKKCKRIYKKRLN